MSRKININSKSYSIVVSTFEKIHLKIKDKNNLAVFTVLYF